MLQALWRMCPIFLPEEEWPPKPPQKGITLLDYLTDWARAQRKPLVLLIDEVDSLWDDVLVSFLRQLCDGFQTRPDSFPQSIALVGLRDIREYRMKARGDNPSLGSGLPFNVKAESFFLPTFNETEVRSLLKQHTDETGQVFEEEAIQKIYEYAGGQPRLANALANEIVAKMLKNDYSRSITADMVEEAKERIIEQRQTHLDSLLDKINEPRVRPIVLAIISGEIIHFNGFDDALRYCRDLGIITQYSPVRFANPIYREIITRTLNSSMQEGISADIAQPLWCVEPDGRLNMDKLLDAFVDFYRWHSESWLERFEYKEAGHQLLLMAFLQRIVNGGGRIEREMALGNGRTDLAVSWKEQVIPVEIRVNRNARSLSEGLRQLSHYMDRLGQKRGYLVLFEKKSPEELPWEERIRREVHQIEDREVMVLGM